MDPSQAGLKLDAELGRSTPPHPSQPALPHANPAQGAAAPSVRAGDDAAVATAATAGSGQLKTTPLMLPGLAAGPSAASSPVTPPATDAPLPASDFPASPPHPASKPARRQHSAPSAAVSAAAVALSSTKRRLDGSLLLQQLLPLSASLGVAVCAGDVSSMHSVLTLLQSVPMTGQLLFASQVARPVRSILQQQVQLQTQLAQQQELQLLEDVTGAARQLLRRWKGLLAAEVEACDEYRMARAHQSVRAHSKQKQRSKADAAGDAGKSSAQQAQLPSSAQHQAALPPLHKRPFTDCMQPHRHPSQQQQPGPYTARNAKQQKLGPDTAAGCGMSLSARSSSGLGPMLGQHSSSGLSLQGMACSSGGDLPDLATLDIDWDAPLPGGGGGVGGGGPSLGAEAAAAADAVLVEGGVVRGAGAGEGAWGDAEEGGVLLVDGAAGVQGQGGAAAAFVL